MLSQAPTPALRAALAGLALIAALATSPAIAQDSRPLALTHARALTMTDQGLIEDATILIRDGRIAAIGEDIKVPAGAQVVDLQGKSVMPGLVQAWSRVGVGSAPAQRPAQPSQPQPHGQRRGGRRNRGGGKVANRAAFKVAEGLYARQEVFGEQLEEGVTTLVVRPSGGGFAGLAARLDPSAETRESLVLDDALFLVVEPQANAGAKESIAATYDQAAKRLEERNQPPEAEPRQKAKAKPAAEAEAKPAAEEAKPKRKPGDDEPEGKDAGEGQKPAEPEGGKPARPGKQVDPNLDALADVLEDQRPAFLLVNSAAALLHWIDGIEQRRFPRTVIVVERHIPQAGRIDEALESLQAIEPRAVLMAPDTPKLLNTSALSNPALTLHRAGIPVGFVLPEGQGSLTQLRYQLMELVRAGLPAEQALRGVCVVPAMALGLDEELGSLAEGRRADLLVFDGDPLDPTAALSSVYLAGRELEDREQAQR